MATAYINIGSNTGDRRSTLERAVAGIEKIVGATARRSEIIESDPWGYESDHRFLNIGIAIETHLTATALFERLMEVEHSLGGGTHRNADGTYRDRSLDIDLIAIDDLTLDTPRLTLPHPRMHLREFVLAPMAELAPEWRHPLLGATPGEMLKHLDQSLVNS